MKKTLLVVLVGVCVVGMSAHMAHAEKVPVSVKKGSPVSLCAEDEECWNPFEEMGRMQALMNRMMNSPFMENSMRAERRPWMNAAYDMHETDEAYMIAFDLPGMDKDAINVTVEDDVLTISGERKSQFEKKEDAKEGRGVYYRTQRYGSFSQSVLLPEDAKADDIKAKYENGVLTLTIGREKQKEIEKQKRIAVQ